MITIQGCLLPELWSGGRSNQKAFIAHLLRTVTEFIIYVECFCANSRDLIHFHPASFCCVFTLFAYWTYIGLGFFLWGPPIHHQARWQRLDWQAARLPWAIGPFCHSGTMSGLRGNMTQCRSIRTGTSPSSMLEETRTLKFLSSGLPDLRMEGWSQLDPPCGEHATEHEATGWERQGPTGFIIHFSSSNHVSQMVQP